MLHANSLSKIAEHLACKFCPAGDDAIPTCLLHHARSSSSVYNALKDNDECVDTGLREDYSLDGGGDCYW